MIVVLDTNAVVQMFGARSPLAPLKDALVQGKLEVAISTGMWLEYEEVIVRYAGQATLGAGGADFWPY